MPVHPIAQFGLPRTNRGYSDVVRGTSGLLTFWPGPGPLAGSITSFFNYIFPPGAFTLEAWATTPTAGGNRGLLSMFATNGALLWLNTTGNGRFSFQVNSTNMDSGIQVIAGGKYHVVGTYDGTSRAIYVNGTLRSGPTSGVTPTSVSTPLVTGNYAASGVANFAGVISDPAVYQRALTAAEVLAHYNAGL